MATLERLYANGKDIKDVRGLEFATNLEVLEIRGNLVSDLSPVAGLTQLGRLGIQGNKVSDISPLTELRKFRITRNIWLMKFRTSHHYQD